MSQIVENIKTEISKVLVGQDKMVEGLLAGLLCRGHILLEGVPGLAKTTAVNALAKTLGLDFKRVQFTPDLLPSDIIGTEIYDPSSNSFKIKHGPVFTNLLLADEINRAPAKVQSALLEVMQERQVTIAEETFKLEAPFLVMATQNPIEQEGVYALPEAQLDRFMMKLVVKHNSQEDELDIMRKAATKGFGEVEAVLNREDLHALQAELASVHIDEELELYIVQLIGATRDPNAFDLESIDILVAMGLNILKIPSGEITNLPYLRKLGNLGKKLILSTGMSTLDEVKEAVEVLVKAGTPKDQLTVLHCNTEYPTPFEDVNLRVMKTLEHKFDVRVGFSDHTPGIEAPVAAVALGAKAIEKHFTLDKKMEGPDHKASLSPGELKHMVQSIRHIELALGKAEKKPTSSELHNRNIARKSIVAAGPIVKGEAFSESNLTVKRPGTGISPMKWDTIIGKSSPQNFKQDELIIL